MSACVRSGYCCQTTPCPWGEAEPGGTACVHLVGVAPGGYACGRYAEIMAADPGQKVVPAFGAGCCSSLNPVRLGLLCRSCREPIEPERIDDGVPWDGFCGACAHLLAVPD